MGQSLRTTSATTLPLGDLLDARHHSLRFTNSRISGLDQFPGQRTGAQRGQGLEFEDLRAYTPGDDIRHIDWNVTARTGDTYTRLYREEREHTTTVFVDLRPSMFTGSKVLKAVRAGKLAAAILWQASLAGDRCAVVTHSCRGIQATRPGSGHRGVLNACEHLAEEFSHASTNTGLPEPHLTSVLDWINRPGRSNGTNIVLSGFDSLGEQSFEQALKITGMRKATIAIMLLDALESHLLPTGHYPYRGRKGPKNVVISDKNQFSLQTLIDQDIQNVARTFSSSGVPLIKLDSDSDSTALLATLFRYAAL